MPSIFTIWVRNLWRECWKIGRMIPHNWQRWPTTMASIFLSHSHRTIRIFSIGSIKWNIRIFCWQKAVMLSAWKCIVKKPHVKSKAISSSRNDAIVVWSGDECCYIDEINSEIRIQNVQIWFYLNFYSNYFFRLIYRYCTILNLCCDRKKNNCSYLCIIWI